MSGVITLNTALKHYPIFYKIDEHDKFSSDNDFTQRLSKFVSISSNSEVFDDNSSLKSTNSINETYGDLWSGPVIESSVDIPVHSVNLNVSIFLGVDDEETIALFKNDKVMRMTYNPNMYLGPELGERSGFLLMIRRFFKGYLWKNGSEIVHRKISIFQDRKSNRLITEACYNNAHARLCFLDNKQYFNGKACTLCKNTYCPYGKEFGNGVFYVCTRGFEIDFEYKNAVRRSEWYNKILENETTVFERIFKRISTVKGKYQNNVGAYNRTAVFGANSAATVVLPGKMKKQAFKKQNSRTLGVLLEQGSDKENPKALRRHSTKLDVLEEDVHEGGSKIDQLSDTSTHLSIDDSRFPTEFKLTVNFDEYSYRSILEKFGGFQNIFYQLYGDGQLISGSETRSQVIDSSLEWSVKINFDKIEIETYENFQVFFCTDLQELSFCKFELDKEMVLSGEELSIDAPFWCADFPGVDFSGTNMTCQFKFDSVIEIKSFWKLSDELKSLFENEDLSPEVFCTLQAADLKVDSDIVKVFGCLENENIVQIDNEIFDDEDENDEDATDEESESSEDDEEKSNLTDKSDYIELSHVINAQVDKFKKYRHFYLTFYVNGDPVSLCKYKINMKIMVDGTVRS